MNTEELVKILEKYAKARGERLSLLLVGANTLYFYGVEIRHTRDIYAEILEGDLYQLVEFLEGLSIEADLTENFSGWSIVSMPSDYRENSLEVYSSPYLSLKVLEPYDFILAKLRRRTKEDIEDALTVAKSVENFNPDRLRERIEQAIEESPRDTQLLSFQRICEHFLYLLGERRENNLPSP